MFYAISKIVDGLNEEFVLGGLGMVDIKKHIFIFLFFSCPVFGSHTQNIFTQIYEEKLWFIEGTYSGQGSSLRETPVIRAKLPEILKELKINTLLDAGCGDFNWLKVTELPVKYYIGVDVVAPLVENNKKLYETENRIFLHRNIIQDSLPAADLILCRDVLNHLPYADIKRVIKNFKSSGAHYLLVTMQVATHQNSDVQTAGWRPLNYLLAPFSFPAPRLIINEGGFEHNTGKSLALWLLDDIEEGAL